MIQALLGRKLGMTRVFDQNGVVTGATIVEVIGTSKGRGFAGVMKRHNFHGGPKTHGQSDRWRHSGSVGSGTTPGRTFKNIRMAGHLDIECVTVKIPRIE